MKRLGARPRRVAFANIQPGVSGEAHFETGCVLIDLRDPDTNPIDTYVHECLHLEHPDWSEDRVTRAARRAVRALSQADAAALFRYIARRGIVWEGEDD